MLRSWNNNSILLVILLTLLEINTLFILFPFFIGFTQFHTIFDLLLNIFHISLFILYFLLINIAILIQIYMISNLFLTPFLMILLLTCLFSISILWIIWKVIDFLVVNLDQFTIRYYFLVRVYLQILITFILFFLYYIWISISIVEFYLWASWSRISIFIWFWWMKFELWSFLWNTWWSINL